MRKPPENHEPLPGLGADAPAEQPQEVLFDGNFSPVPDDVGYPQKVACSAAAITYRQLDYWARTKLVEPSIQSASGSGSQRLYSFRDILMLRVIKGLLNAGIQLQQIRIAVAHLHSRGVRDLSEVTLMSDGISVYECTEDREIRDLLSGGQGMFAIGLGSVCRDVQGSLHDLPTERGNAGVELERVVDDGDELAKRRAAKRRAG